jgi:DNA ligase-associated metallophosphoesterase
MYKEVKGTKIIHFQGEEFVLSSDRVLYYPSENALILSDIHLGKAGHFRKNGIPVPIQINQDNLDRLDSCIQKFNPKKLLFLGDLFHSESNSEWYDFRDWRSGHSARSMTLVLGNHELYSAQKYEELGLEVVDWIDINGLRLQHEPENTQSRPFNGTSASASISGHIHPGVKLAGKGRQSLILPCFAHYLHQLILPAFGTFTGLHLITLKEAQQLYAIAEDELITLK